MQFLRILIIASQSMLGLTTGLYAAETMAGHQHHAHAAALTDAQKQFLSDCENVRTALAVDDLAAAKTAAAAFKFSDLPAARQLAKADSLNSARVTFKKLSILAVQLAKGQAGYYVVHCPMADSDWVQTTSKISNPYLGPKMVTCGSIQG